MTDSERIPTNMKTLLILEVFGTAGQAMTAAEINEQLGLPKQTVHRLCTTLERNGFMMRKGRSKQFYPAGRLVDLCAGILHSSHSQIACHQIMKEVARTVGETVNFVVPDVDGMRYIDRVETDWPLRVRLPIGSNVPFHCTASGKCFMASLAPNARHRLVSALTLAPLTRATHTDPAALLDDLAEITRRGYSLDAEEFIEGLIALAVPVTDPEARFLAALAFHGPVQRISIEQATEHLGVMQAAAKRLSDTLLSED